MRITHLAKVFILGLALTIIVFSSTNSFASFDSHSSWHPPEEYIGLSFPREDSLIVSPSDLSKAFEKSVTHFDELLENCDGCAEAGAYRDAYNASVFFAKRNSIDFNKVPRPGVVVGTDIGDAIDQGGKEVTKLQRLVNLAVGGGIDFSRLGKARSDSRQSLSIYCNNLLSITNHIGTEKTDFDTESYPECISDYQIELMARLNVKTWRECYDRWEPGQRYQRIHYPGSEQTPQQRGFRQCMRENDILWNLEGGAAYLGQLSTAVLQGAAPSESTQMRVRTMIEMHH